jgi:hypothetical protein
MSSDYEVLKFSINIEDVETVNNSMIEKFNTQKANWNKFSQYVKDNHSSIKSRMTWLMSDSMSKNLNERAKCLRDVIIETLNKFTSKRWSCENSKVWWINELTQLKKNLARVKRTHKVSRTKKN